MTESSWMLPSFPAGPEPRHPLGTGTPVERNGVAAPLKK